MTDDNGRVDAQDGISNTFSIVPDALGKDDRLFMGDIDLDLLRKDAREEKDDE